MNFEEMVKMLWKNIDKKQKFISHVTKMIRKCAYQLNALKGISVILRFLRSNIYVYMAFT